MTHNTEIQLLNPNGMQIDFTHARFLKINKMNTEVAKISKNLN